MLQGPRNKKRSVCSYSK